MAHCIKYLLWQGNVLGTRVIHMHLEHDVTIQCFGINCPNQEDRAICDKHQNRAINTVCWEKIQSVLLTQEAGDNGSV